MIFQQLFLKGAFLIEPEPRPDERGLFARTWCQREFAANGLNACIRQCNTSFNLRRGTLRGLHYQEAPFAESRLVRCTRGAIYDVIVDLRPDSATYCKYFAAELTTENRKALYVPEGFAHGFQTLEDSTEVFYQMSEFYSPEHARGVRWNDPAFGVEWPEWPNRTISERDANYPDYQP